MNLSGGYLANIGWIKVRNKYVKKKVRQEIKKKIFLKLYENETKDGKKWKRERLYLIIWFVNNVKKNIILIWNFYVSIKKYTFSFYWCIMQRYTLISRMW